MVNKLLDNGANIESEDGQPMTPLHYAVVFSQPQIAKLLLNRGTNVSARATDDEETPGNTFTWQYFPLQNLYKNTVAAFWPPVAE